MSQKPGCGPEGVKAVDRGRPSGNGRRGLGSDPFSVSHVACARKKKNSAGVGKTISRGFFLRRSLVPGIIPHFSFFAHTYVPGISLKTARLATTLGSPCRDRQVWGTLSSKLGRAACCVPCVTRAHTVCMRCFPNPQTKQQQAAGPNSSGATL